MRRSSPGALRRLVARHARRHRPDVACSAGSTYPSSSPLNSAWVMIRTSLFGFALVSSSQVLCGSGAGERNRLPSGDHTAGDAPLGRSVSCCASPPVNDRRWSCGRPSLDAGTRGRAVGRPARRAILRTGGEPPGGDAPSVKRTTRVVRRPSCSHSPTARRPPALTAGPQDGARAGRRRLDARVPASQGRPAAAPSLSLTGGEAQQLTDLPKGASPAVWSPDGKTIAFTSTTTAEDLAKKDTSASRRATSGSSPRPSSEVTTKVRRPGGARPHLDGAAGMPGDEPAKARQVTPAHSTRTRRSGADAPGFISSRTACRGLLLPARQQLLLVPAAAGGASDTVVDINGPVFGPAVALDARRSRSAAGSTASDPLLQSVRPVRVRDGRTKNSPPTTTSTWEAT